MADLLAVAVGVVLAVFASVLAALAGAAWTRFREGRFLLVGLAFLIVAVVAALAIVAEFDITGATWFDEAFTLEPVPLALLLVAVLLIYGAMVRRNPPAGGAHHART